jgi:predicted dehydrogenase
MRTLRAGVVGLGVGERHLASYAAQPGVEVVAVCDIDAEKLRAVADRHGVARRCLDYRDIVSAPDIDVVSVCSYDDGHAEQAAAALRAGKHVMVEKPAAVTRAQADDLAAAWRESGRLLTSNLILRRSPRFMEVKRRAAAGDMGTLFYLEGDYIHDASDKIVNGWRGRNPHYAPFFGGGVHLFDLLRWIADDDVVSVCAMGGAPATREAGGRVDDTEVALLRFSRGAMAKVLTALSPRHPKFHAVRVFGTRATFENRMGDAVWHTGDDPAAAQTIDAPYPGYDKGDLLPDFIAAIRDGREPQVGARDVLHVMDVCLAAEESRRTGRFVDVAARPQS